MKYENFEKCKELVEKIQGCKNKLATLNSTDPSIEIKTRLGMLIYELSTEVYYEGEYSRQALELVNFIKEDLQDRINNYKEELEKL